MRIHRPGQDITFDAAADLSTHQFKFVVGAAQSGTSQQARVNVSGANGRMLGVLQNKPAAANLAAVVRIGGTSKLVVDGTTPIAVGDVLTSDASGRGIKATAGQNVGGIALEASSAANDIIEAQVENFSA
jgi:hypothetical protein